MSAEHQQQRLARFTGSLPMVYREFFMPLAPNPGLCEYLLKFWQNFDSKDAAGDLLPEVSELLKREGLLLYGPPRAGKTQIACELVRRQIANPADTADARFISAVQWGCETSRRAKQCDLDNWVEEQLAFAWRKDCASPYLLIDDLDKTRLSATVESQLFNLIETATSNQVTLVVTTNCAASALAKRFTDKIIAEAILARLKEFCTPMDMAVKPEVEF